MYELWGPIGVCSNSFAVSEFGTSAPTFTPGFPGVDGLYDRCVWLRDSCQDLVRPVETVGRHIARGVDVGEQVVQVLLPDHVCGSGIIGWVGGVGGSVCVSSFGDGEFGVAVGTEPGFGNGFAPAPTGLVPVPFYGSLGFDVGWDLPIDALTPEGIPEQPVGLGSCVSGGFLLSGSACSNWTGGHPAIFLGPGANIPHYFIQPVVGTRRVWSFGGED